MANRHPVLESIKNDTEQLLLCVLNARSLRNKSAAFVDLVCDSKADLFAVSETWLTDNDTAILSELTPQGYKLHHCPRSDRRGGGTALIFKESINVEKVSVAGKGSFEASEWSINPAATTRLRVVIVYRPPYSVKHPVTTSTFITEFSDYLESLVMSSEPLLILGDFNIHMDLPDDTDCKNMSDLLESMGLIQHVLQPTHELGHTLDLIITRISDNIIAGRPYTGELFSDHFPVFCQLKSERPPVAVKHLQFRKIKSIDRDQFSEAICSSQLCLEPPDDLDTLVNCYNETLRSVLDTYAPVLSRDIIVRPRALWFNEDIRKAKRTRRRAEKKWRTIRLPADLVAFKKERNRVVNLMNEARRDYYDQFIEDNSTDQRRLFMASKSLLNMQSDRSLPPHTDVSLLANDMGELFITKIANIRLKLDGVSPSHLLSTPEPELASEFSDNVLSDFQCQTVEAVRDMITSGKKKSCILDPIPVTLLSACLDPLLPVITNMVNLSLRNGYFADAWKTAVVQPLLKKPGLDLLFKNFQPISNLQFVSKLTERVVANQIQCHMIKNNLVPQLQSAYRSHHSTETALLKVKNDLLMNMNKGQVSLLVLLDLSAAFDTVDHRILLKTLQAKLGVCGSALSWFKSYLEGRSQRICIKETLSRPFDLKWGVPQGSCLGPLLFTIYSSDLFSILESHLPTAHAYADDTQLYLSFSPSVGTGEVDAVTAIENCIQDIRQWMCVRKLMLNDDKTEFLLVGTRKQLTKVSIDGVRVGDYNISPSSSVRNLGTWFDPHLDMDVHITKTCSSAFYYLYNIRHIWKYLSKSSTETLIHAFITSRLDYCNSLLYGLPKYQLSKLQRVMNASARLVCCAPKSCHITPLLRELHWLPVCYRIEYKIILLTFKVLHNMAPDYLRHLISVLPPSSYNLRRNHDSAVLLTYPKIRTKRTLGDRSFSCAAPRLWNLLPTTIRSISS